LKDTKVTHLSTWIVLKGGHQRIEEFKIIAGEMVEPIQMRVKIYDEDVVLQRYTNLTLESFL